MKGLANRLGKALLKLHRDEKGADMVEYILIIAIVSLPLLGVLIYYWHDIVLWVQQKWGDAKQDREVNPNTIQHN
jgi:Flp pilus assembly pilin Flp